MVEQFQKKWSETILLPTINFFAFNLYN